MHGSQTEMLFSSGVNPMREITPMDIMMICTENIISHFFLNCVSQKLWLVLISLQWIFRKIVLQLNFCHFNSLHYMHTQTSFWLRVWLFDRLHLYQSRCRMDLYFNEATRELEWSCSRENRPLDLDKSLFCHNMPMWDFLIIYPS